jgi:hypothetical protein
MLTVGKVLSISTSAAERSLLGNGICAERKFEYANGAVGRSHNVGRTGTRCADRVTACG